LLEDVRTVGRVAGGGGGGMLPLPIYWRLDAELEVVRAGGVLFPPYVEFRVEEDLVEPLPLTAMAFVGFGRFASSAPSVRFGLVFSLIDSELLSFLKLALERRRKSFRNEGAIVHLSESGVAQLL
jgi:hypothetical protein